MEPPAVRWSFYIRPLKPYKETKAYLMMVVRRVTTMTPSIVRPLQRGRCRLTTRTVPACADFSGTACFLRDPNTMLLPHDLIVHGRSCRSRSGQHRFCRRAAVGDSLRPGHFLVVLPRLPPFLVGIGRRHFLQTADNFDAV